MTLAFTKMSGAGNDFVLLDNREGAISLTRADVARLCDRHRGVGADGVMLLKPCASGLADWAWDFYNSDGSTAEMCGNGARCFARFIQRVAGMPEQTTFETAAGVISARFQGDRVMVSLTDPKELKLDLEAPVATGSLTVHSVNTGVPHAVVFVPEVEKVAVQRLGAELRYHGIFAPRGTNVNFVQTLEPGLIRVRTYERGVEGETQACGTGITASALVTARVHKFKSPIRVKSQGGDQLEVAFQDSAGRFSEVTLTGPADFVFTGQIEL